MGTQSDTHPLPSTPASTLAPLWIALFLLLSCASSLTAAAQISALSVPLILPSALVFDAAGNLYLAETGNHVIRKIDTAGLITTIAGTGTQGFSGDAGLATAATLDSPQGLALDVANNLYIADTHNHRIRKLNLATGIIITIAGTGTPGFSGDNTLATAAQLSLPTALALDSANNLYLADTGNHRIRKISAAGIITTIAGRGTQGFSGDAGPATSAVIDSPAGLALDSANNLYLADSHNHRIRKLNLTTGIVSTIAGTGTPGFSGDAKAATSATLAFPHGLAIDAAGNLYLADTVNHRIRRIDGTTGIITTIAGDGTQAFAGDGGPAISASLDSPEATAISPSTLVTLVDTGNQRVRQLTSAPASATPVQTIAGLGPTVPGVLTLTAPAIISYGTGQLTSTLASSTSAAGIVNFFENTSSATISLGSATLVSNIATLPTATLSAGVHNIIATYTGDQTHTSVQSSAFVLNITPQQLTAVITPAALLYGQPIPTIVGTLNGVFPQDAPSVSATFITAASSLSEAGIYPVTATLSGPAAGDYILASPAATLTINPAPTVVTLSDLATVVAGSAVSLTAHVASTTTGMPTGSIILLDSANPLLASPVSSSGDAAFTIPSISAGSHSFTALYNGNSNFTLSTSAPQLIFVGTAPVTDGDFTLAPTGPTTQTIPSGNSASYTFNVQFQGNMSSPIALAATGLPNLATASFNPPTLPPGNTANTFSLTIATPNTVAQKTLPASPPVIWSLLLFPIATLVLRPRNSRVAVKLFTLALLTVVPLFVTGCGDRINPAGAQSLSAKTYIVTVTGTATTSTGAILQHSATVTLLLEQSQ
ncbi:MAG TPA: Ig-like domain repeat protein [Edaphobacter sp.]|jgi:sugar lactone lactonase YvrE|nr:Ig-like domain repeat protein [Edaphobacter sp.]